MTGMRICKLELSVGQALTFPDQGQERRYHLNHRQGWTKEIANLDAASNATRKPEITRNGQPWRTIFPLGREVERYPRVGWDRPKASDHCPVAMTFDVV
jgi:hypothetical protein